MLNAMKATTDAAKLLGSKGGHARKQALSPERRKEIARKAAQARWAKWRKQP